MAQCANAVPPTTTCCCGFYKIILLNEKPCKQIQQKTVLQGKKEKY